ncbi:hypothetical protein MUDAN_IGPPGNFN_03635 [Lactiplantibacillus mudanjiangensis]|nr:hypothetical protein MUDAN_IGPPGNFN_03635 [Lactiplantibacillus mudanjiangensis]
MVMRIQCKNEIDDNIGRLSDSIWYEIIFFFFQAEDGIRDSSTSRGLGDVYKRQSFRSKAPFKGCYSLF